VGDGEEESAEEKCKWERGVGRVAGRREVMGLEWEGEVEEEEDGGRRRRLWA
jgi:hypothetical protein